MGQSQDLQREAIPPSVRYEVDPRLIEFTIELPSSFPSAYQKLVQEVQAQHRKVHEYELYLYLAHCIDSRFSRYNVIDEQAFHSEKSIYEFLKSDGSKFQDHLWVELATKESFRKVIDKFIHQYELQTALCLLFEKGEDLSESSLDLQEGVGSLRKAFAGGGEQRLEEGLLKKLFYRYYLNVLRSYASRSEGKEAVVHFHEQVGRLLCVIVGTDYFGSEELLEMAYCMVYLEKVGMRPVNQFDYLRRKYYRFCLEKKLTIGVEAQRVGQAVRAARLYLDELYLSSMREAEDPEIGEQSQSLSAVRVFPVQRAKQRGGR